MHLPRNNEFVMNYPSEVGSLKRSSITVFHLFESTIERIGVDTILNRGELCRDQLNRDIVAPFVRERTCDDSALISASSSSVFERYGRIVATALHSRAVF